MFRSVIYNLIAVLFEKNYFSLSYIYRVTHKKWLSDFSKSKTSLHYNCNSKDLLHSEVVFEFSSFLGFCLSQNNHTHKKSLKGCAWMTNVCIYKVVISVCLSDHNLETLWQICPKFWLGNSEDPQECFFLGFEFLN